jgi:hypothetical protein
LYPKYLTHNYRNGKEENMPVRKVSNRGGNIIGRFPSLKLGRMVAFESLIERDFIYLLDFESDVAWFAEQPLTIPYQHEGKNLSYTPDFHVIRDGRNILVECKLRKFVNTDDNQRKFAAAQAWCEAKGWVFQVVSDEQLRRGFRVHNVKLLTQFARYNIGPAVKHCIRSFLASTLGPVSVTDVMVNVAPERPQMAIIPILHLAFHHELVLPLDEAPISTQSPVRLAPQLTAGRYV